MREICVLTGKPLALVVGMLMADSLRAATSFTLPSEERILPSSLELERKTEPWCPGDCAVAVPFVANYRKGAQRLVFVGTRHAFHPTDPTMRAVDEGFAEISPKVVILEGFPSAMGENPAPLVELAHHYGEPDASDFGRGELMYAASIALKQGIPFVGGEPTEDEQIQVLKEKGFTDADIAFSSVVGWFSQALRSGDIRDTSPESLAKAYPRLAQGVRDQIHLEPPSLDEFRQQYRQLYGTDIVGDDKFPLRIDIGDTTRHGQQTKVSMMTRDRQLLGLIEQQLSQRHSVLVVYGGSHWATLSAALEKRLGKPKVTPFLK
jgi:hypothetical protein